MPRVTQQHGQVGVTHEPLRLTITIAEGGVYVVGPGGHYDPEALFEDLSVRTQTEDVFVASTLRGAVGDTDEAEQIPPLASPTPERWPLDTVYLCNRQGSGGSGKVSLRAGLLPLNNSGQGRPAHPGHGSMAFVVPRVPDGTATVERRINDRKRATGVGVYATAKRTSGAGSYLLHVERVRGGVVTPILATTFDLESLTNTTISKPAVSDDPALLDLRRDDIVRVRAVSNNADLTTGDLVVDVQAEVE